MEILPNGICLLQWHVPKKVLSLLKPSLAIKTYIKSSEIHKYMKWKMRNLQVWFSDMTNLVTPQSTYVLEKLTVAHLVKKLPTFYELKGSLMCTQEPTTGSYPELHESNPHLPTLLP